MVHPILEYLPAGVGVNDILLVGAFFGGRVVNLDFLGNVLSKDESPLTDNVVAESDKLFRGRGLGDCGGKVANLVDDVDYTLGDGITSVAKVIKTLFVRRTALGDG